MANILRETVRGIQCIPIEDELLTHRSVFLVGEINQASSDEIIKQLLYLERTESGKPVTLLINSPGGEVKSGLAVYDMIRLMESPVNTVCTGMAASMAAILFLAGEKRVMLPHAEIMIHDPSYNRADISGDKPREIQHKLDSLNETRLMLDEIIAERTGKPLDEILSVTQEDTYYKAKAAIEFGLADAIVTKEQFRKGDFNL